MWRALERRTNALVPNDVNVSLVNLTEEEIEMRHPKLHYHSTRPTQQICRRHTLMLDLMNLLETYESIAPWKFAGNPQLTEINSLCRFH